MQNLTHKKYLIASALFFIASCSLFFFLYHGVLNGQKVFEDARAAWVREETRLAQIRMIDRSIREVQAEKNEFDAHFAHKSDIVPFLDSLERSAESVGATMEVTSVDNSGNNMTLDLNLRASGSFDSLYRFLTLLENSYYELEITTFSLSKDISTQSKWNAVASIKLLSYVRN